MSLSMSSEPQGEPPGFQPTELESPRVSSLCPFPPELPIPRSFFCSRSPLERCPHMSGFVHANLSQALCALWGDLIHSGGTWGGAAVVWMMMGRGSLFEPSVRETWKKVASPGN